jgi:pentatricopeptide repeat protein
VGGDASGDLVGVQATVASYRRRAYLSDAAPGLGSVYSRRDAGGGGICNTIVNALAHAGRFQDACNLLEKFPMYLAMCRMLFYKALSSGTEDGRDES